MEMWLDRVLILIALSVLLLTDNADGNTPKPRLTRYPDLAVYVGESITFICQVNVSSGSQYLWYKDSQDTPLTTKGSSYTINPADLTDRGTYRCRREVRGSTSSSTSSYTEYSDALYLPIQALPVPSLELRSGWLDVFPSERVELICGVQGSSDWLYSWTRDGQELQKDHAVSMEGATLSILSAAQVHSGNYRCRGRHRTRPERVSTGPSKPLALKVYGNTPKPQLTRDPGFAVMYAGESITFNCQVSFSSGWQYLWYKDSQDTPLTTKGSSYTINSADYTINPADLTDGGTYWCRARRGSTSFYTKHSDALRLPIEALPVPSLELRSGWLDVFPSERVELICGVQGSSDWLYSWTRDGQELQKDHAVSMEGATLSILSAAQVHSGNYRCRGRHRTRPERVSTGPSKPLALKVYGNTPKPQLTRDPGFAVMYAGESITFNCQVSFSSGWQYLWYKDSQDTPLTTKGSSYTINSADYTINPADLTDGGTYWCRARRGSTSFYTEHSDALDLPIQALPVPSLELRSGWLDVFPSERVELICGVQGSSDWLYSWTRDGQELQKDHAVSMEGATLSILSAAQVHSGNYRCRGRHRTRPERVSTGPSKPLALKVYGNTPKPQLTRDPGFAVMYAGESITFNCQVSFSSGWQYLWYKDSQDTPLTTKGSSYTINSADYTINPADLTDGGTYWCRARRGSTSFYTKHSDALRLPIEALPVPSLELRSGWLDVFPSERVELICGVQGSSDWLYSWTRDGQELQKDHAVSMEGATLSILSAAQVHSGNYRCRGRHRTRPERVSTGPSKPLALKVYGNTPKPQLTRDPGFAVMYAGESITFNCQVSFSSGWQYLWYKDSQDTPLTTKGSSYTINSADYTINPADLTDGGTYWCRARRGSTSFYTKHSDALRLPIEALPVPSLELRSGWLDVFPSERVELICGVQGSSDWLYSWTRDGQELQKDHAVSMEGATLSILSAAQVHSGNYRCRGRHRTRPERVSTGPSKPLALKVYGNTPKPQLTRYPGFAVMYAEESITFNCQVNVSSGWQYLWYKDSQDTPLTTKGSSYTINSADLTDRGTYRCRVRRGSTSFYTEYSNALGLPIEVLPWAVMTLETGWTKVLSTDSLALRCEIHVQPPTHDQWNYTWYRGEITQVVYSGPSDRYIVSPEEDPDQSQYICRGIRPGRPSYSTPSEAFRTKNLVLKRKLLLSISGCLFFGIIAVFIGCIALRLTRKPEEITRSPDTDNLFLTMAELKSRIDAPSSLDEYIVEANDKVQCKDNGETMIDSESTPLPITDQVMSSENFNTEDKMEEMQSFMPHNE